MGWPWKSRLASRRMGSRRDGSLPSLRGKPAPLSLCRLQRSMAAVCFPRGVICLLEMQERQEAVDYILLNNDMDPGSVPAELQGLSKVEELLSARAFPIMSIYRKHGGQYGDTTETYPICLKILKVFWIASHLTSVACQSWWSESKVQVSVSKIILHTGYCTL